MSEKDNTFSREEGKEWYEDFLERHNNNKFLEEYLYNKKIQEALKEMDESKKKDNDK